MKKAVIASVALVVLLVIAFLVHRKYNNLPFDAGKWTIKNNTNNSDIAWIPFIWDGDSLGNRYFDKAAISIPVKLEGIKDSFNCQLDLGSNHTLFYENPLKPYISKYAVLSSKLTYYSNHLFGGEKLEYFSNLHIVMGNAVAASKCVLIKEHYGDTTVQTNPAIGTIGVDVFQDKILIMDYPNRRLSVVDELPQAYKPKLFDININKHGFIVIPVTVGGKKFKVMYDSGSSIFSLITSPEAVAAFSKAADSDTLLINAWGEQKKVIGRPVTDTIAIAGQKYTGAMVYHSSTLASFLKDSKADAITGNALFWNNILVLDFKHKKIGIL